MNVNCNTKNIIEVLKKGKFNGDRAIKVIDGHLGKTQNILEFFIYSFLVRLE